MRFSNPVAILETRNPQDVLPLLEKVANQVKTGLYAAGFITYEAACGLDASLQTHSAGALPLVWFMLCEEPVEEEAPRATFENAVVTDWLNTASREDFDLVVQQVKQAIAAGDAYQVNYALRLRSEFEGEATALFEHLLRAQNPDYAAFVSLPDADLCSLSTELFFSLENGSITCKPMKGTVPRGMNNSEDETLSDWLQHSEKNRAENLAIVDMIRSDLGRIAEVGSVQVDRLFGIERYPTVHQMTSIVSARTTAPVHQIMRHMFPSASITGGPKMSAMKIIRAIESQPRGIYTGSIGFIAPDDRAQFNVAIRTVTVDRRRKAAESNVGGGIVWDSLAEEEYAERLAKAAFLNHETPVFDLLETILWQPASGFFLLSEHLQSLRAAARFFDIPLPLSALAKELDLIKKAMPTVVMRIGLRVRRNGHLSVQCKSLVPIVGRTVKLTRQPVNTQNVFVYHNTTFRQIYDDALALEPDADDVLLTNLDGYLTASCHANLVLEHVTGLSTPPAQHGLLNDVFRARLIRHAVVREQPLSWPDLQTASRVWLVNSVWGWMQLEWIGSDLWKIVSEGNYRLVPPDLMSSYSMSARSLL